MKLLSVSSGCGLVGGGREPGVDRGLEVGVADFAAFEAGEVAEADVVGLGDDAEWEPGLFSLLAELGASWCERGGVGDRGVDLAGDVALQAAHDVAVVEAFCSSPVEVVGGAGFVVAAADHHDAQGVVGGAVAALVEPVPCGLA